MATVAHPNPPPVNMRWCVNLNGLATSNWPQWLAWGREVHPAYILIMDDRDKARQWKTEVGEVIYRAWHRYDTEYHLKVSAKQAADDLARENENVIDMWQYFGLNEGGGSWHRLQDWLLEFAELSKARGFKVTTCGLALSKLWSDPQFVADGNADPLLHYARANPETFLLDVHGYVTGKLSAAQVPDYPQVLFDRERVLASEYIPVEVDGYKGYNGQTNWGMFRECWAFNARATELFGEPLPYVITEYGYDWNSHIVEPPHEYGTLPDGRKVRMEDELRARFTDSRYDILRGVLAHRIYAAWLLTGTADPNAITDDQFTDFIMRDFKWGERTTPPNCKGIMPFAENFNWRKRKAHDYGDPSVLPTLLPKMKTLQRKETMLDPNQPIALDDPRWRQVTLDASTTINVRSFPTTQDASNKVGALSTGQTYRGVGLDTQLETYNADSWNWYPYLLADFDGQVWIAAVPQLTTAWGDPQGEEPPVEPPPVEPPDEPDLAGKAKAIIIAIMLLLGVLAGYFGLNFDDVIAELQATPTIEIIP